MWYGVLCACVSIRQRIRQHTSDVVREDVRHALRIRQRMHQHTSDVEEVREDVVRRALRMRRHTSAHASAYFSIRQMW